ncbi:hypothetical protein NDU88_007248 [Pleurodeles waltl]|uniref:Uncharacterized protein n=1 Tax=Pleurodeles waltl TaxID=8319 RepID=A0AAV7UNA3_PLEWA|nr:hypothetical protein NDU88_007248 [Pleurodeles waltl]
MLGAAVHADFLSYILLQARENIGEILQNFNNDGVWFYDKEPCYLFHLISLAPSGSSKCAFSKALSNTKCEVVGFVVGSLSDSRDYLYGDGNYPGEKGNRQQFHCMLQQ